MTPLFDGAGASSYDQAMHDDPLQVPSSPPRFRVCIEAMSGYVPGEQVNRPDIIKLNTNENPYPPSAAVSDVVKSLDVQTLNRYPDPGATALRAAVAEHFGTSPEWVLAGNGSDELLTLLTRLTVEPGALVVWPEPSYSLYPVLAAAQGAETRALELTDAFELPVDAPAQVTAAALVFIARPNAPTGNAFSLESISALCHACPGLVVIDEAYVDFGDSDCLELVREFPNAAVVRTVSKGYSLAAIRLGFVYAQPRIIDGLIKIKDSYNVNRFTQEVGVAALKDHAHMEANAARIKATRARVVGELEAVGFSVIPSEANFLFVRPPVDAAELVESLRERNILVRYFPGPRTGDFIRVTIGTDAEMDRFIAAVAG